MMYKEPPGFFLYGSFGLYVTLVFCQGTSMMKLAIGLSAALLVPLTSWAEQPAKIFYRSQTDFVDMSLVLKTAHNANAQYVGMSVTLSPEAQARTAAVTTQALNKSLTLYLNGRQLSTSTVRSALDSGRLSFSIPREMLPDLLPSLLN